MTVHGVPARRAGSAARIGEGAGVRRRVTAVVGAALALTAATAVVAPQGAAARGAGERPRLGACGSGALCLWENPDFSGKRLTYELSRTDIESCVRLPGGFTADAYANRTGRPVTAYQSGECAETGEFHTHPSGSWTPESAYQVRAFKIWER